MERAAIQENSWYLLDGLDEQLGFGRLGVLDDGRRYTLWVNDGIPHFRLAKYAETISMSQDD